jgi:syntaxin 16
MATKQLEKYGSYREEARSRRKVYLSPLLNQGSDDPLMLTVANVPDGTGEVPEVVRKRLEKVMIPAWLKKIKPLESALDSLLLEMTELTRLHGKKLHNLGFQTQDQDAAISGQSKKITRMMRDIKEGIKGLALGVEMSPQVTYMKDNIQKVLASRLQDIGNQFRRDQLRYQSELEATTQTKAPKSKSEGGALGGGGGGGGGGGSASAGKGGSSFGEPSVSLDDSDDEEGSVTNYDIGLTDKQQERVETNRIRINQRMQEIRDIAQQVEELGQMFNDIALMIHEQGSLLDRIDYNIESADHSITEGKKQLEIVVKSESGFSKRLCFLMLLIIIFGIVVIIVVLTKPR